MKGRVLAAAILARPRSDSEGSRKGRSLFGFDETRQIFSFEISLRHSASSRSGANNAAARSERAQSRR